MSPCPSPLMVWPRTVHSFLPDALAMLPTLNGFFTMASTRPPLLKTIS